MKKVAVGLVILVMTITNPAMANTANDEQAVRKVLASFDEAFNRHDADAVSLQLDTRVHLGRGR
jgi:hypothetical protein